MLNESRCDMVCDTTSGLTVHDRNTEPLTKYSHVRNENAHEQQYDHGLHRCQHLIDEWVCDERR